MTRYRIAVAVVAVALGAGMVVALVSGRESPEPEGGSGEIGLGVGEGDPAVDAAGVPVGDGATAPEGAAATAPAAAGATGTVGRVFGPSRPRPGSRAPGGPGGSGTGGSAGDGSGGSDPAGDGSGRSDPAGDRSGGSAPGGGGGGTGGSDPARPNFASDEGVTETTIRVGVLYVDFPGAPPCGIYDQACMFQTFAEAINESGGVNGRKIEIVLEGYSPITEVDQQRACASLTEGKRVFAVLTTSFFQYGSCLTVDHGTFFAHIDSAPHRQMYQAAPGLEFSVQGTGERVLRNFVEALYARSDGSGIHGRKIGTVEWNTAPGQEQINAGLIRALERKGNPPKVRSAPDGPPGPVLTAAVQAEITKQCNADVQAVMLLTNPVVAGMFVQQGKDARCEANPNGWKPRYYTSDFMQASMDWFPQSNPANFEGAIGVTSMRTGEARAGRPEPAIDARCREVYRSQTGQNLPRTGHKYSFMQPICGLMADFAAAAGLAGADLTRARLSSGYRSLGTHAFPFSADISYGPTKFDGADFQHSLLWHRTGDVDPNNPPDVPPNYYTSTDAFTAMRP